MTEQQAQAEVAKHQAELIATLDQRNAAVAKRQGARLATEIEAEVNRRMLQIAQEQGIPRLKSSLRQ
jgi:hypothetical protein